MADEFSINAKITADTSGYKKGINEAQKQTKNFSKSLSDLIEKIGKNGLVQSLAQIDLAMGSLNKAFGVVEKAISKTVQTVTDLTNSYKTQARAEIQLEQTAKNNPLLKEKNVSELKKFASELQRISSYGDEQLLPMMAQFAGAGRSQEQIQKIMKTALDLSASGMMDLDSAVKQLNATLSGTTGRLGLQISGLKNLTEEELKNGKAIDVIAEKYKGLSEEVTKTVGTSEQLKMAWGDLKEVLGEPFEDVLSEFRSGITKTIIAITDGIKKLNEAFDVVLDSKTVGKKVAKGFIDGMKQIKDYGAKIQFATENLGIISDSELKALTRYLTTKKNLNEEETILAKRLQAEYDARKQNEINIEKETEALEKLNAQKQAEDKKINDTISLLRKNRDELNKEIRLLQIRANATGEAVKIQDLYNAYLESYIKLVTTDTDLVDENNEVAQLRLQYVRELGEKLQKENELTQQENSDLKEQLEYERKILEEKKNQIEAEYEIFKEKKEYQKFTAKELLQAEKNYLNEKEKIEREAIKLEYKERENTVREAYNEGISTEEELKLNLESNRRDLLNDLEDLHKKYNSQIKNLDEEYVDSVKDKYNRIYSEISKVLKKVYSVISKVLKTILSSVINVVSGIVKGIGNLINKGLLPAIQKGFSSLWNFVQTISQTNFSELLDKFLIFEDNVLSFFLTGGEQVKVFLDSILSSVLSLLQSINEIINAEKIGEFVNSILTTLGNYAPDMVSSFFTLLQTMIEGALQGIETWIESGNMDNLSTAIISGLDSIINIVVTDLPRFIQNFLVIFSSLVSSAQEWFENGGDSKIQALGNTISSSLLSIIDFVVEGLPVFIETIVSLFSGMVSGINSWFEEDGDSKLSTLGSTISTALLDIITTVAEGLPTFIEGIISLFSGMMDGINSWYENDEEGKLEGLGETIANSITSILNFISDNLPSFIEVFLNVFQGLVTGVLNWIADGGFKDLLDSILEAVMNIVTFLVDNLPDLITGVIGIAKDVIISLIEVLPDLLIELTEAILEALPVLITAIVEALPDIVKALIEAVPKIIQWIVEAIPGTIGVLIETVIGVTGELIGAIWEIFTTTDWAKIGKNMLDGIVNGFKKIGEVFKKVWEGFVDSIKKFFGIHSPSTLFEELGQYMLQGLVNGFSGIIDWFKGIFENLSKMFSNFVSWTSNIFEGIGDGISTAWDWVSDTATNIGEGIVDGVTDALNWVGETATNIGEGIASGVTSAVNWVSDTAGNIGSGISKVVSKLKFWETGVNNAPRGLAVVGESGPELIDFRGGERVYNSQSTKGILQNANSGSTFNVTFNNLQDTSAYTMIRQLKQYNRNMAINGVL